MEARGPARNLKAEGEQARVARLLGEDFQLPQGGEVQARDLQRAGGQVGEKTLPRHEMGADHLAGIELGLGDLAGIERQEGSSKELRSMPWRYSSISTISRSGVSAIAQIHSGNSMV